MVAATLARRRPDGRASMTCVRSSAIRRRTADVSEMTARWSGERTRRQFVAAHDRDRRDVARGVCAPPRRCAATASTAASSRSAPSRTCPTTGRRCRRSCSPGAAEPDDIVLRKQGVDDLELDWRLGAPRDRASTSRAQHRVDARRRRAASTYDGLILATGSTRAPACPCIRTSTACSRCARSTTRWRCAPSSTRGPKVVVIGAGLHRRRGRGDVPRSAASTSRSSRACRIRWCAGSAPRSAT